MLVLTPERKLVSRVAVGNTAGSGRSIMETIFEGHKVSDALVAEICQLHGVGTAAEFWSSYRHCCVRRAF